MDEKKKKNKQQKQRQQNSENVYVNLLSLPRLHIQYRKEKRSTLKRNFEKSKE